jgi:hypothetical protein
MYFQRKNGEFSEANVYQVYTIGSFLSFQREHSYYKGRRIICAIYTNFKEL